MKKSFQNVELIISRFLQFAQIHNLVQDVIYIHASSSTRYLFQTSTIKHQTSSQPISRMSKKMVLVESGLRNMFECMREKQKKTEKALQRLKTNVSKQNQRNKYLFMFEATANMFQAKNTKNQFSVFRKSFKKIDQSIVLIQSSPPENINPSTDFYRLFAIIVGVGRTPIQRLKIKRRDPCNTESIYHQYKSSECILFFRNDS